MGIFSNLFGGGSAKKYALAAMETQKQQKVAADAALQGGFDTAKDYYTQAGKEFDPYINPAYSSMYANAVGLGGEEGKTAALSAFQNTNPGYKFDFDQGMQGVLRAASAGGNLASGNTLTAASQYGTGLADKYYQQWLDNVRGGMSASFAGSQGKAGTLGQIGSLGYDLGKTKAAGNKAYGDTVSGLQMGIGQAKMQGAANLANLGMGAANMIANGIFGGGGGGGGASGGASSLFNLFGGGGTLYK